MGVRSLFLRGEEKIRNDQEAQIRLECLFTVNQPQHTVYMLNEELRAL